MTKRSLFLSVAAGLLASMVFASPSHAGSEFLATFTVTAGTADEIDITYSSTITGITLGATNLSGLADTFTGNSATLTFSSASTGYLYFTVSPSGFTDSSDLVINSKSNGGYKFEVTPFSVPEPGSMALLGIGMTGFLAFRRLFKRNSVV
jgi:PEP-CTERM motif